MIDPSVLYTYKAKIIRVIDGDTVDAEIDVGFYLTTRVRLRLLGVYAPEITGTERAQGLLVRDFVIRGIYNSEVLVTTQKTDHFGRWLGTIYRQEGDGWVNFNEEINEYVKQPRENYVGPDVVGVLPKHRPQQADA